MELPPCVSANAIDVGNDQWEGPRSVVEPTSATHSLTCDGAGETGAGELGAAGFCEQFGPWHGCRGTGEFPDCSTAMWT
jgi:hypothetical protein